VTEAAAGLEDMQRPILERGAHYIAGCARW